MVDYFRLSFRRKQESICSQVLQKQKWIPIPRLREDKLHGNDTDCVSPKLFRQKDYYDRIANKLES